MSINKAGISKLYILRLKIILLALHNQAILKEFARKLL
jgi:hypothetical protein